MTFLVTYSYFSEATPENIWDRITDVQSWPSWDVRLEKTRAKGPAKAGSTYFLTPVAGNEIEIKITSTDGHKFCDIAKVEIGTIETERSVVAANGGSIVTQTMRANIDPGLAQTFNKVFWEVWSQGIIDSTKGLANAHVKSKAPYGAANDVERLIAGHRNVA